MVTIERRTLEDLVGLLKTSMAENRKLYSDEKEHMQTIFDLEKERAELKQDLDVARAATDQGDGMVPRIDNVPWPERPQGVTDWPGGAMLGGEGGPSKATVQELRDRIASLENVADERLRAREDDRISFRSWLFAAKDLMTRGYEPNDILDEVEKVLDEAIQETGGASDTSKGTEADVRHFHQAQAAKARDKVASLEGQVRACREQLAIRKATIAELEVRLRNAGEPKASAYADAAGPDRTPDIYADSAHMVIDVVDCRTNREDK